MDGDTTLGGRVLEVIATVNWRDVGDMRKAVQQIRELLVESRKRKGDTLATADFRVAALWVLDHSTEDSLADPTGAEGALRQIRRLAFYWSF